MDSHDSHLGGCIYSALVEDHPHWLELIHMVSPGLVRVLLGEPTGLSIVPHTDIPHIPTWFYAYRLVKT